MPFESQNKWSDLNRPCPSKSRPLPSSTPRQSGNPRPNFPESGSSTRTDPRTWMSYGCQGPQRDPLEMVSKSPCILLASPYWGCPYWGALDHVVLAGSVSWPSGREMQFELQCLFGCFLEWLVVADGSRNSYGQPVSGPLNIHMLPLPPYDLPSFSPSGDT